MARSFPTHARVVIIGGGIVGCSVAYHLTKLGWPDVVLLEQGRLSSGTTWHAAGLVGQLRSHSGMTRMIRRSTEIYAGLEQETGLATGWKQCGSLSVARTPERMVQLRRTISAARAQGVAIEELSPSQAGEKWPLMRTDDLEGAVWLPGDGKANPSDITQALARGARTGGAAIFENTHVTGIEVHQGRARAVETDKGRIECEIVCICSGQWSREVGRMCGVTIPLHSAEHMYIVTEKMAGVHPDLPVMRDPDGYIYFKEEVGGLVMGGFEPNAKPWGMKGIPRDFAFQLLPDDWDQFEILMENALIRVPALESTPVKTFVNGPESFTPDNNFILGEAPETRGVFVGAGFNSAGIASAGGAGQALAEWILAGEPTQDLWPVDIRRFAAFNGNGAWLHDRIKETLGLHYMMPWPNRELASARPFRRSPLYDRLAAKGAVFGSKMGWERPNYFARTPDEREIAYSFGRQNWFDAVIAEQHACRESVALFDMTSFAKFRIEGPDALATLQHLCTNDIDVPVERTVYSALANARGGYESDVTVARLADEVFMLVTGSGQATRDADWMTRNMPAGARATITDVTAGHTVLALMGPRSRELLASVSDADFSDEAFPFGAIKPISLGYATCLAMRRSYVGELGYELYVPVEFAAAVYDRLSTSGAAFGLRDAGYYAIEALRLEKGYRAWGRELTPDYNPYEAGLGFAVKLDKGPFIGSDALATARAAPRTRQLVSLLARGETQTLAWGGELIAIDGKPVGEVTSAAYSAALGGIIALGYIEPGFAFDQAWLAAQAVTLDLAGEIVSAQASLRPFFDPKNDRIFDRRPPEPAPMTALAMQNA